MNILNVTSVHFKIVKMINFILSEFLSQFLKLQMEKHFKDMYFISFLARVEFL